MGDKVYLPKQVVTRGKPGYRGEDIVVIDPATGKEDKAASRAAARSTEEADRDTATADAPAE
jgi:hypothetical protein